MTTPTHAADNSRPVVPSPGRLGLVGEGADAKLAALGWTTVQSIEVLRSLSRAPDADLALTTLSRLKESLDERTDLPAGTAWKDLDASLHADETLRARLFSLTGSSTALGDHLVADPHKWPHLQREFPVREDFFAGLLSSVDAQPARVTSETAESGTVPNTARDDLTTAGTYRAGVHGATAVNPLRVAYRDQLMVIAAHDLAGSVVQTEPPVPFGDVVLALSDLADAALTAALAVGVANVFGEDEITSRLGVIAMGKCGARELNYISDVDIVFVSDPADPKTARVAGEMMRIGSMAFFEVDAALRPEGKRGDLVRTLDSHVAYYKRWAKTWEFQALLKARPMTGDMELANAYVDAVGPMVWTASEREDFVHDVQRMRRRVEENVPNELLDRELKLGLGGLRDIEFAVQLLQMVHGRGDETLRVQNTVEALARLVDGGYVARADTGKLIDAYEFLRLLEHRLQLQRVKRTHLLPEIGDEEGYRWLARAAGIRAEGMRDAPGMLAERLRVLRSRVRRLHEKLFYRPLLDSIAAYDAEALSLSSEAMERQLAALGFGSPRNAVGHLRALIGSSKRRGRIQSLILPTLMEWLSETADPDAGLLAYRKISEEHQELSWYLRLLRDDHVAGKRLMTVLGNSAFVRELLQRAPNVILDLADGAEGPKLLATDAQTLARALTASAARHSTPEKVIATARSLRRAELARIGCADILGMLDVKDVGERLTSLWNSVIEAALSAVITNSLPEDGKAPAAVAVISMGRLGGREQSYGSDADVLFVCRAAEGVEDEVAIKWATSVFENMRKLLGTPSSDPPLEVDADLRPEGRSGPLVRTLGSYRAYYEKWAEIWEMQSLLRASMCAGDTDLAIDFLHMVDEFRYPVDGVPEKSVLAIRRMKARVDTERLPRGANRSTHTKLGRGGLADVEWTVQLLTMQSASQVEGLHTTSTLEALSAAASAELVSESDAEDLRASWTMAARVRNALVLVRGKPTDELPTSGKVVAGVAQICSGKEAALDIPEFINEYMRITRIGHKAVDKVFWGE